MDDLRETYDRIKLAAETLAKSERTRWACDEQIRAGAAREDVERTWQDASQPAADKFRNLAEPFVDVAYAQGLDASPLATFLRTGDPLLVEPTLKVLDQLAAIILVHSVSEPVAERSQATPKTLEQANAKLREIIKTTGWPGSTRKAGDAVGCSHELIRQCEAAVGYIPTKVPTPKLDPDLGHSPDVPVEDSALDGMALREEVEAMKQELPPDQQEEVDRLTEEGQRRVVASWQDGKRDKAEDGRKKYTQRRAKV